jgi:hypothetical protein
MAIFARTLLLLCALLLSPSPGRANIGEDSHQLAARYGAGKIIAGQMVFVHDGYSISVYFDGEHSAMEIFTHNTSEQGKTDLTQKDIDNILAAESDGNAWNPIQVHSGKPTWMRSDEKLIARFSPNATGKGDDASVLVIMLNGR